MIQRGRKSAVASLAVVDNQALTPLPVPPGLSAAERGVWLATVNSKPADWFGTEHVPIMVEYVRSVCRGHVVDGQLKAFEPEWFATDEGLRRYQTLSELACKNASMATRLATSMRITHQSVWRADKASLTEGKSRKLWQREEESSE